MKNKAIKALLEMGMPANIKGFKYIVDAMCLFAKDETLVGGKTTLYWEIAQKNNDKDMRVERAIRHAFSVVLTKGNSEVAKKYLATQNTTNGNLLATLFYRLQQET